MNNEEILELGITPNQYFLAEVINNKRKDLFEKILKIDSEDKIKNDLYKLYIKGYLNCELCEAYTFDFNKLKVDKLFKEILEVKVVETKIILKDNQNDFAKELYNIFPEGITTGNLNVKSGFKDFSLKLDKFRKEHKSTYNDEVIKKAFLLYVDRCRKNNYQFMKQIGYFIYKNNESILEGICEEVVNKPDLVIKDINNGESESSTYTTI